MTPVVEANSFSSINLIAAQPPTSICDVINTSGSPLVLYITRVPGRRDVFLTPLKPRDRVVSAQDIQSALYYVHAHSAEDLKLRDDDDRHSSIVTDIPPKLPARSFGHRHQPFEEPIATQNAPVLPPRPKQIHRKPVFTDITNSHTTKLPMLPPRPLPSLPDTECDSSRLERRDQFSLEAASVSSDAMDGCLTLVRREPATAAQWNVATISDAPAMLESTRSFGSTASTKVKKGGAPMEISITNPAYFTFAQDMALEDSSALARSEGHTTDNSLFTRRLYLPSRQSSVEPRHQLPIDMRKSGYCFESPWKGLCHFTTSTSGRNLVCKHALPDHHPYEVSELRFNLPPSSTDSSDHGAREQRRQSYFSGHKHPRFEAMRAFAGMDDRPSHQVQDEFHDELDLSLGQEMAGGGFGGRQPKLGKLIIHPHGLAMLDLLVAANIGLWWRAWEKLH